MSSGTPIDDKKQVDLIELYQKYCEEESCRVNSALVRFIEKSKSRSVLESLDLKNNYLGAKGLRPVVRLIDYCQTLTSINLEGNGATNELVDFLCSVLERHLGVTTLNLQHNPITAAGGKRLLELVERNRHITALYLADTDVFEAVQSRIQVVTEENRRRVATYEPQLIALPKSDAAGPAPVASATYLPAIRTRPEKPTVEALPAVLASANSAPVTNDSLKARITEPQPRPPAPAIATKGTSRLAPSKLKAMRDTFAARYQIASEVKGSEANRKAYEVRSELMALESNSRPQVPIRSAPPVSTGGRNNNNNYDVREEEEEKENSMQSFDNGEPHTDDSLKSATDFAQTIPDSGGMARKLSDIMKDESMMFATAPPIIAEETTCPAPVEEPSAAAAKAPEDKLNPHTMQDLLRPDQVTFRSSEEQFPALFDQGCREYANKNLDGAYVMWNKALSIASDKRNREWIAVVTSNLQRLSYEILVKEGKEQMVKGELEEAGRAFELAQEVAQKAHNALWVSEMQEARKELLNAVFHRCHAAASAIFEKAQQVQPQTVTPDDYYMIPGTDVMVNHTDTFVTQWTRLLLVQEAIGMWSEAAQVVKRLSGAAGAVLATIIDDTLDTVSCFLVTTLFDAEEPKGISFQQTGHYHYHESMMLIELWRDIISHVEQHMHHDLLRTIAVLQLGNLYLSSNQLADAIVQFERVIELGQTTGHRLLETTGLTMSALLNWQRADHAVAEHQLGASLTMWDELLQQQQQQATTEEYKGGESRGAPDGYALPREELRQTIHGAPTKDIKVRLLQATPAGYVQLMLNVCYHYRMCLLVNTYRYREALEAFEEALNYQYHDLLHEKIRLNYPGRLTVDQIEATSRQMGSPLVYYGLAYRYDWSIKRQAYDVTESVYIWVVPKSNAVRFIEMNVTREFKTTVGELIEKVRVGLCLNPVGDDAPASMIISILPRKSWIDSLQMLYLVLVDPIMDYLHDAGEDTIRPDDVVTIIPSRSLWVVPYNALINPRVENRYVVEDMSIQLAFSAAQCALCALNVQRVRERGLQRNMVVCHQEVDTSTTAHLHLLYPIDVHRSLSEGRQVLRALTQNTEALMKQAESASSDATVFTSANTLVDDLDVVRSLLPQSHYVHFGTATTSNSDRPNARPDENIGALCLPAMTAQGLGLLWADEIAHSELFAELVTLSNTNMSPERVCGPGDDVLGLLRSFFCSGVPCIVAGQWCTPDMVPAELFVQLYSQLPCAVDRREASRLLSGHPTSRPSISDNENKSELVPKEAPKPHKAVLLANVIRDLINADSTMRFAPRCWAGYYCVGCGAF